MHLVMTHNAFEAPHYLQSVVRFAVDVHHIFVRDHGKLAPS